MPHFTVEWLLHRGHVNALQNMYTQAWVKARGSMSFSNLQNALEEEAAFFKVPVCQGVADDLRVCQG